MDTLDRVMIVVFFILSLSVNVTAISKISNEDYHNLKERLIILETKVADHGIN